MRGPKYGSDFFDGPLVPYSDPVTRQKIMAILDQRVVMVVFGDNANLSASVAKTIGALLVSELKENSVAGQIRRELEQFLEDQKGGYTQLVRSEGRPVLLRTRRDQEPVVWLGRPRRQVEDRARGLPRQRVSRAQRRLLCFDSECPWTRSRTWD